MLAVIIYQPVSNGLICMCRMFFSGRLEVVSFRLICSRNYMLCVFIWEFIHFILFYFYCCSSTVVSIFLPPLSSTPPFIHFKIIRQQLCARYCGKYQVTKMIQDPLKVYRLVDQIDMENIGTHIEVCAQQYEKRRGKTPWTAGKVSTKRVTFES